MIEIINRGTKMKIFALYYGQNVHCIEDERGIFGGPYNIYNIKRVTSNSFLLLKDFKNIIEEDAIKVAQMYNWLNKIGEFKVFKNTFGKTVVRNDGAGSGISKYHAAVIEECNLQIDQVDYLRSKGYALSAYSYSVEQLIENGIFKLIENDKK